MKSKRSPKRKIVIDESKTAGKPSELVRYVALEPPLQRKRISPYRGNHNILRTHTVNYVDVSETTTERSDEISSGAASSNGSIDRARRKLAFEDDDASDGGLKQKDSGLGKTHVTQPQKDHDVDMGDDEVRKEKPRAGFVEKPAAKPPPSPQKLQRKNDLKEIERKQGDRVSGTSICRLLYLLDLTPHFPARNLFEAVRLSLSLFH